MSANNQYHSGEEQSRIQKLTEFSELLNVEGKPFAEEDLDDLTLITEEIEKNLPKLKEHLTILEFTKGLKTGKYKLDTVQALLEKRNLPTNGNGVKVYGGRGPKPGVKRGTYKKLEKSTEQLFTANVLDAIVSIFHETEDYMRGEIIFARLCKDGVINADDFKIEGGINGAWVVFGKRLARCDQSDRAEKIKAHRDKGMSIGWGLEDFGTPEHARRKALLSRANPGNRIASFGRMAMGQGV